MKKYNDKFYETLHKNSVKRRRMFSLLLVLSLFTTSGVVWMLRGIGITMANEPICEIAEHKHTEECYENTLICGLEESNEHTHTDECYTRTLICDIPEHTHTAQCYTDVPIDAVQQDHDDALAIANITTDESSQDTQNNDNTDISDGTDTDDAEKEICYEDIPEEAPIMLRGSDIDIMADEPAYVNTIDNIAYGIKFTLFDYGDDNLEGQTNNYDISYTEENGVWGWRHNNWKDVGINTGRNPVDDIMFFAYGTPAFIGTSRDNDDTYTDDNGDVHNRDYNIYTRIDPDKNNYSGDYNTNNRYPKVMSGNRPVQGIVKADLDENGYPVINNTAAHSLDYLFDPDTSSSYKTVYKDVNHLLYQTPDTGKHLLFNSNDHYAYYNQDTHDFTVYSNTFDIVNDAHHKSTDIDPATGEEYGGNHVDPGFKIGFFPFDQYDTSKKDPNYNTVTGTYNHHFGMTMETKFSNPRPENINDDPVVFKYSGDDDMWVFVDGRLVLDLGGIHEPAGGMIDFTNGLVWVQDNEYGQSLEDIKNFVITNNYIKKFTLNNQELTLEQVWNLIPKPIGVNTSSTSADNVDKWKVTKLTDYFTDKVDTSDTTATEAWQYSQHEIKMFYLERGGCYSNLAMEMNLPTLKPLSVIKNVDYGQHLVKGLYEDLEYEFQIYEWNNTLNKWVIPDGIDDSNFTLKDGERKEFEALEQDRIFKVVEKNYDPNIFSGVTVNGQPAENDPLGGKSDIDGDSLMNKNLYSFVNTIAEETKNISVKKNWDPPLADDSPLKDFTVKFKVMRTDSVTGEVKQVALRSENDQHQVIKTRTFAINSSEWATGYTIPGLLTRYGDHYYTYTVEELNVPNGYNAAYSIDGSNYWITNKSTSNVDIYVKKEWENYSDTNKPQVQLTLKRKKIGYQDSTPTNLTVNILDEAGNLIKSKTFSKDNPVVAERVYAGGDAEISYILPEGVLLYTADKDYPMKSPATENNPYMDFDDGILVLRNLSEEDNTISFKVTTDNAYDPLLLLHHSFTKGVNGWEVQGDGHAQITSSNNGPYAKNDALLVKNRTAAWNGAKLKLDSTKFLSKHTYTFSAYVKSPYDTTFIMTFNDGMEKPNSYHRTDPTPVEADKWTQISATVKIPETVNPYGMFILIETDERDPIFNVSAQNWKTLDNWEVSGATTISTKSISENTLHAVTAGGITSGTGGGIDYNVPRSSEVSAGRTYRLNASVAGVGEGNHTINCVVKYKKNGQNVVETIGSVNTSSTNWGDIITTFSLPSDYVANSLKIGFTADGTEGNTGLEVWSYRLTMVEEEIRIDEFIAVEGDTPVTVDAGTGVVKVGNIVSTTASEEDVYNYSTMQNYGDNGWYGFGSPNVSPKQYPDTNPTNYAAVVTNRTDNYFGLAKNVDLEYGIQYHLRSQVSGHVNYNSAEPHPGKCDHTIKATLTYTDIDGHSQTQPLGSIISTNDTWVNLNSDFTLDYEPDTSKDIIIYYEADGTGADTEFEVWSSRLYKTVEAVSLPDKIGYDESTGQYVSDYSNFDLALNEASVTTPLKLDGAYIDDTDFSKTITLSDNNSWTYHWQNYGSVDSDHYLSQNNEHFLYKYYIEENWIGSSGNTIRIVDKELMSNDGNFLVTYKNNGVAANTENSPIIVNNRYIWYKLPATGGEGLRRIYIAAAVLITISIISGYAIIRRERRYR